MEDLHKGIISLPPEYFSADRMPSLKFQFTDFAKNIQDELTILKAENKGVLKKYAFDITGRASIPLDKLTVSEKKLYEEVRDRFSFANFFLEEKKKLYTRNEIYYSTQLDEERSAQVVNLCMFLDTMLAIIQGIDESDFGSNNFVIAALLDDVRYKLIILLEDILDNDIDLDQSIILRLTSTAIKYYYDYLLGIPQITVSRAQLFSFATEVRSLIISYLQKSNGTLKKLRTYKEADVPFDNLLFVSKLKKQIPKEEINWIIGIRFGGIELPFLIRHFIFPNAEIKHLKISKYSSNSEGSNQQLHEFVEDNKGKLATKNVLIVDDSITTARTANTIIETLKHKTKNIFFSCVYHPEAKRIPQMKMKDHGGVNIDELKKCCVLKEANYTASANTKGYLGRNKKFDLTKEAIKDRLSKNPIKIKFTSKDSPQKLTSAQKVFIASDKVVIPGHYDVLCFIRNHYNAKKEFEIVDDWIDGPGKRIHTENQTHVYKEISGRNFLHDAINDIQKSDLIVIYYPAHSVYMALLFRIAQEKNKKVLIFYSHKEDTDAFKSYSNVELIQVKTIRKYLK